MKVGIIVIAGGVLLSAGMLLSACAGLHPGQSTEPQAVGNGKYLVEGYGTSDAITAAQQFCAKAGRTLATDQIIPSTQRERAVVTFACR